MAKYRLDRPGIFKDREERNNFNVALLGFKMLMIITVYNLADGVVDEFHDEIIRTKVRSNGQLLTNDNC